MQPDYDDIHMAFLELVWGPGFLSPGGPDEVARILDGVDLAGKRVLDLGCGSGGITIHIAETWKPARMTGFDVEQPVIDRAKVRLRQASREVADRIAFIKGDPGLLPFASGAFDVVFSKDALVHVSDKDKLFSEIARVLVPGGTFAASDWLIGHDGPESPEMKAYLDAEGLSFGMASPKRYRAAMEKAGLGAVTTTSRAEWYLAEAKEELKRLSGPLRAKAEALVGKPFVDKNIKTWKAMLPVLETGEHCPTHLRGVKTAA